MVTARHTSTIILTLLLLFAINVGLLHAKVSRTVKHDSSVSTKNRHKFMATVTAYNTTKSQGGRYNALGKLAKRGTVAVSRDLLSKGIVKFGDIIHIEGHGHFVVEDTTASRLKCTIDICFEKDIIGANNFGKQKLEITLFQFPMK